MSGDPLDRIAHKLQGTLSALTQEEAEALVGVARAARALNNNRFGEDTYYHGGQHNWWESSDSCEACRLAAALARLDKVG